MPYIDADEEQEIDAAFNKIDSQRAKIKRLTDALNNLVRKGTDGRWRTTQHGDTDVTAIIGGILG